MYITTMKSSPLLRQWLTLRVLLSFLRGRLNEKMENMGHLFFHLTVFHRKAGYVDFNVTNEECDGHVLYRTTDEEGKTRLEGMNFRVSNRWLLRRGAVRSNYLLWQVKSAGELTAGLNVHSVVWGNLAHNRTKPLSPFDISRLPSEEVIAAHHARLKKFQDFMAHWFPSSPEPLAALTTLPSEEEVHERTQHLRDSFAWMNSILPAPEKAPGFTIRQTASMILKRAS